MQNDPTTQTSHIQPTGGVVSRRIRKRVADAVSGILFAQILQQKMEPAQPAPEPPRREPFPVCVDPLVPNLYRAWKEYGLGNAP